MAGVPEFWLADARKEPVVFRIHHLVEGAYSPAQPDAESYLRSNVLACRFRLDAGRDARGHWKFKLLDRP